MMSDGLAGYKLYTCMKVKTSDVNGSDDQKTEDVTKL